MPSYIDLKDKFDHLQKRTWELFEYGRKRESKMEETIAIAWKQFERISECSDIEKATAMARSGKEFMEQRISELGEANALVNRRRAGE